MFELSLNDAIGHAAFALTAAAYSMRRIVALRAFAMLSLSLSLWYNLTLPSGVLWLVVGWLSVFFIINVVRISFELVDNIEARVPPEEKRVLASAFPAMHTRDWRRLAAISRQQECAPGETLLCVGDQTDALAVLLRGSTIELRADGRRITRDPGTLWGELTFVLGEAEFAGSPCHIAAGTEGATVLLFPYTKLRSMATASPRLRAALHEGFVRSAGVKHGLLEHRWEIPVPPKARSTRPHRGHVHVAAEVSS
jgi:hypothetical protein